jgi:trans-2,3-dihydro-3-hydroxyanthranilate isomerase
MHFEMPAGIVTVQLEQQSGVVVAGRISAPQPLSIGAEFPPDEIARCVGLATCDIDVSAHQPILVSVGNPYVVARVLPEALARCEPDIRHFRSFIAKRPELNGRFSLHLYSGSGPELRARMFAPLAGTVEDPATGSANAPLAALLLSLTSGERAEFLVRQGEEMGRPSLLRVDATRRSGSIYAGVAGRCVAVLRGEALVGGEEG